PPCGALAKPVREWRHGCLATEREKTSAQRQTRVLVGAEPHYHGPAMRIRTSRLLCVLALGSMVPLGCKKEEPRREMAAAQANAAASSTPPEIVVPQAATAKSGTPPLKVAITWTDPAAWERLPQASPMRAASYKIPLVAGEEGK